MPRLPLILAAVLALGPLIPSTITAEDRTLLNASYDVTREFYAEVNAAFAKQWKDKTGETVVINQSHGGSSKQARAIIDGLPADVVTMNQSLDIDQIAEKGHQLPRGWATLLPNHSVPTTSTILFLVRAGNPKHIHDWADLVKPGVTVVVPNPRTSGNGRYSYLAAWAFAKRLNNGDEAKAKDFVADLFRHVPVLDTGGRGATTTFVQRGIGDVLLTFENEADLIRKEASADPAQGQVESVVPSISILAENPVAVVEKVAAKHGTAELAKAYLEFLYSPEGQELAAKHHFRPIDPQIQAKYQDRFPKLDLVTVDDVAGSWAKANATHFVEGGVFDQITEK